MFLNLTVYLSNQLELLYQILKIQLFANKDPFARRLIVVPSQAIKSWLMLQMANDPQLKIASGIEICYLDQALPKIYEEIYGQKFVSFPNTLPLSFKIESLLEAELLGEDPLITPLKSYLLWNEGLSRQGKKRLITLAEQLAPLFQNYALYGQKMILEWEQQPAEDWQAKIWKALNVSKNKPENGKTLPLQISLFALSFIPQSSFQLLQSFAAFVEIRFFQLSPCQLFWSDLLSEKESQWLLRRAESQNVRENQRLQLEELLQDRNPLLANLGKLGRQMMMQMEESQVEMFSQYFLPQSCMSYFQYAEREPDVVFFPSAGDLTALQAVQADLLLLRNPEGEPRLLLSEQDRSIQIHEASSKMREIEILYDRFLEMIDRDPEKISANDFLVMAPDIMEYAPFIQAIFGAPESPLDFQIMDLSAPNQNPFIQAFLKILDLASGKWEPLALFQLLEFPFFRDKHHFTLEEVEQIKKWLLQVDIRWGSDGSHRQELLQRHYQTELSEISDAGTWNFAMARLLRGLAVDQNGEEGDLGVDQSLAGLLGKWVHLIRCLREDLKPLGLGEEKSLEDWGLYLQNLFEAYLGDFDEEETGSLEKFIQELLFTGKSIKALFPFESISERLSAALQKHQMTYRETHLHAIKFCSLLPMRAIPAQVIALIGMNQGGFPKMENRISLDLLAKYPDKDLKPSQSDYDRYLFLEALISARQFFLISYVSYSATDPKPQPPSLLVTELVSYLDQSYLLGDKLFSQKNIFHHPFQAFAPEYFQETSCLKNFSMKSYRRALALSLEQKAKPHQFINDFRYPALEAPDKIIVDVKDLIAFGKNPLKSYFNKTLNIFLREDFEFKDDDDFTLSPLTLYDFRKMSLKYSGAEIIQKGKKQGKLPQGFFEELALLKIEEEIGFLKSHLKNFNVSEKELGKIYLMQDCEEPVYLSNDWEVPALVIKVGESEVHLVGELSSICAQGLVSLGKDERQELAKNLPEFLIFASLVEAYRLPILPQFLMLRSGKIRKLESAQDLLKDYLDYYLRSLKAPSPLIPEWIHGFIKENQQNCQEYIQKQFNQDHRYSYNDYVHWLSQEGACVFDEWDEAWKHLAHALFEQVLEAWYPSRSRIGGDER